MQTNEVLENIKARRSVRAYTDRQVSEEDLQAILEAATFAPSGMPVSYTHLNDEMIGFVITNNIILLK